MTRPSPRELFAEMASLADRFHWPLDTLLDLEHPDRHRFLAEARRLHATGGDEDG
ncbi:MAG TPA: hypothetical protein VNV37_11900 [Solirubrobacteraceae bacterium]|jgi:hypothetical protein|nr:hypothetical protein [Solirubrobacteraceae bacterium]